MKERIRELRKCLDMTMDEFGARIGLTKSAISFIESGRNGARDQTIFAICREFGVNERWLRTGEGEMFEQTRETVLDRLAAEYSLDKEQVSVIENFLDLSPQERTLFLTQMRKVFGGPAQHSNPQPVSDAEVQQTINSPSYQELREKKEQAGKELCTTAG